MHLIWTSPHQPGRCRLNAADIVKAGAAFDEGAAQLTKATERAASIILDAHGLQVFATSARAQVPAAVEMVSRILRERASATIAGSAPAELPKAIAQSLTGET